MHIWNDIVSTVTHGGNDPINSAARYDAENTAVFKHEPKRCAEDSVASKMDMVVCIDSVCPRF